MLNKKIVKILYGIEELLKIKGVPFKPSAYHKAALSLENLEQDVSLIYEKDGLKGLEKIFGVGKSIAKKIEGYIKKGRINYYEKLKEETAIRQIVTHYFETKGLDLSQLKRDAKKRKIIYSRFTKPAKQLLELAGSVQAAKKAMSKVAEWAKSRDLDYAIETVFKKWLEIDRLKPKEIVKKPFYDEEPMVWSQTRRKWYVISRNGEWLEFAGEEKEIKWRIIK